VLHEPLRVAESIRQFLDRPLNIVAMSQQVDTSLYRQRSPSKT
jgi:hypothetical protein